MLKYPSRSKLADMSRKPNASLAQDHALLLAWYREHQRELPWRLSRDPYRIWVSEVMLQQTTVAAVIPYFEKFLKSFPTLKALASAPESEVLKNWAGLGYYSRARNLHKAAKRLAETGFPKTAAELIEFPGFGPYTSAAVASIAFGDPVGVLDGNVIRVLCRKAGLDVDWWNSGPRQQLQALATQFAEHGQPDEINQALMELGATVCTPQSPSCLLCPWVSRCEARRQNAIARLPRPKPRKKIELWSWEPELHFKKNKVALITNRSGPVLRGQWIFPGEFKILTAKPSAYDTRHGITHHDLYVRIRRKPGKLEAEELLWVETEKLPEVNPSKLLQKVLESLKEKP